MSPPKELEATSDNEGNRNRSRSTATAALQSSTPINYQKILMRFYLATFLLFSLIGIGNQVELPSENYFADKGNLFNQYFVKLGWAWTFWPLLVYIPYTSYKVFRDQSGPVIIDGMIRWAIGSAYWYMMTQWCFGPSVFDRIYHHWPWASCSEESLRNHHLCHSYGHQWDSFDVSGHCFLLLHSSLVLWEEIRASRWSLSAQGLWRRTRCCQRFDPFEMIMILFFSALLFLWYWMLIVTCVYFHTWSEKLVGVGFGFAYWALSYCFLFKRNTPLFSMPLTHKILHIQ